SANLREEHELAHRKGRLATPRFRSDPSHADDVAEVEIDAAELGRPHEQLNPSTTVDQVEKHQVAQVPAAEDSAGDSVLGLPLASRLQPPCLSAHRRDLLTARKAHPPCHYGFPSGATAAGLPT